MIEGCLSLGARPSISFCAQIYFVVAVIFLFDITYLSKSFNHSKNVCKMIKFRHSVQRTRTTYIEAAEPIVLIEIVRVYRRYGMLHM